MRSPRPIRIKSILPPAPESSDWEHGTILRGVNSIEISLGDAHWYGGGAILNQQWPLEKLSITPSNFVTSDNGQTGLLGILEPFWFNSAGGGLAVEGDSFSFSFNAPTERTDLEQTSNGTGSSRPRLAIGSATDGVLRVTGENLTVRIFDCRDAREAIEAFWRTIAVAPAPPPAVFEKPMWTTWAHFKNDINQEKILKFAEEIVSHGFTCSTFGIDAKWQHEFGDSSFDRNKFPDPVELIRRLHDLGFEVTLWCVPFFNRGSRNFEPACAGRFVMMERSGGPFCGRWWEGEAAFLDVTNRDAMKWHFQNLDKLRDECGFDGFKFDAGEAKFYDDPKITTLQNVAPNGATRLYIEQIGERFPWSDARAGWRTQHVPLLFRQWDKTTGWGFDNGLASCISQTVTLNLLGYRFQFADMVGGNEYGSDRANAELMIRWTQAVAPMPVVQFSIPPWRFGADCAEICARYMRLHAQLAPRFVSLARENAPIIRPLWWLDPRDEQSLIIDDQYLVGDELMVAPVIVESARARDVYFPRGRWRSFWDHALVIDGGRWIRGFNAPLSELPLFERVQSANS